jgi:hypothetical protein
MGSSPRQRPSTQRPSTQRPVCQDVSDEAQDHHVGISTVLTDLPHATFFYFQRSCLVKRNQVRIRRYSGDKRDVIHE